MCPVADTPPAISERLAVTVGGLRFASPVLNASGCFNPGWFDTLFPLASGLGGIVTKTVTAAPRTGNPQPRTVELPGIGMLNSIGLQNPGLDYFLEAEAQGLKAYGLPLVLSLAACSMEEFAAMTRRIVEHPAGAHVDALEINLSCPNVEKGGVDFGNAPETVREAVRRVVDIWAPGPGRPVFAKLTPNVTSIGAIAEAALEGGATGLTAINTLLGAAIDIRKRQPILARVAGGYSGPGVRPVAIRCVWELRKRFPDVPIIGVGGASSAEDVLEFLMAGANLVQVGTICFRTPDIFLQINRALEAYVAEEGFARVSDLTGCAHGGKILPASS